MKYERFKTIEGVFAIFDYLFGNQYLPTANQYILTEVKDIKII